MLTPGEHAAGTVAPPQFLGMDHAVPKLFGIGVCLGIVLLLFSLLFGSQFCRYGHPRPGPAWRQGRWGALGCLLACLGLGMVGVGPIASTPDKAPGWVPGFMLVGNLLALAGLILLGCATVVGLGALRQPAPAEEPRFLRRVVAVLPPALLALFFVLYLVFGVQ
jgi:hypothetical protein